MDPRILNTNEPSTRSGPAGDPTASVWSTPGAIGPEAHREETEELDDAVRWALALGEEADPLDCADPVATPPPPPCPPHYWLIGEGPESGVQIWRCHHCGAQKEHTRLEESGFRTRTDRRRPEVPTPSFAPD